MRMPGTAQWKPSFVKDVIAFDRNLARNARAIAKVMGDSDRDGIAVPDDSLFAFVHAAELAFATGQVEVGLRQCRDVLKFAAGKPMTLMQMALLATIGSITGRTTVNLTQYGARVSGKEFQEGVTFSFEEKPTPYIVEITRILLAAWACGRQANDQEQALNAEILPAGIIRTAVLESEEGRIVFGRDGEQYEALTGMIRRYSYRLEVMRSDREYWDQLVPLGDLIDWSLLGLLVFIFRTSPPTIEIRTNMNLDGLFICDLALSIVHERERLR